MIKKIEKAKFTNASSQYSLSHKTKHNYIIVATKNVKRWSIGIILKKQISMSLKFFGCHTIMFMIAFKKTTTGTMKILWLQAVFRNDAFR